MFAIIQNHSITENDVLTMHKLFYEQIDAESAGAYRTSKVIITGSKYPVCPPGEIQSKMDQMFHWIQRKRSQYHPVEFAAQLHLRFVTIHPFVDGNGRIARLLMNTSLLQDRYMIAIIPPILRQEYIELLEESHSSPDGFIAFIMQRVLETQKEVMKLLHIPNPI
jgi:Fic family protein